MIIIAYQMNPTMNDYTVKLILKICKFEIKEVDGKLQFVCPSCGEKEFDHTPTKLRPCRRVCGYISTNQMNQGRMAEIKDRIEHI